MIELAVKGMTCGGCVSAVTRAVKSVDPKAEALVDVATGSVRIDTEAEAARFVLALAEAGYPASDAVANPQPPRRKTGCCCG